MTSYGISDCPSDPCGPGGRFYIAAFIAMGCAICALCCVSLWRKGRLAHRSGALRRERPIPSLWRYERPSVSAPRLGRHPLAAIARLRASDAASWPPQTRSERRAVALPMCTWAGAATREARYARKGRRAFCSVKAQGLSIPCAYDVPAALHLCLCPFAMAGTPHPHREPLPHKGG